MHPSAFITGFTLDSDLSSFLCAGVPDPNAGCQAWGGYRHASRPALQACATPSFSRTSFIRACKQQRSTGSISHRKVYPTPARLALWVMTEIAIIGSDIQEVIGSAIAILLLTNGVVPLWAGVLITAADSFAILLVERLGVRLLEAVFGGLISVMAIAFGVMYFIAGVPTARVLEGVLPGTQRKGSSRPATGGASGGSMDVREP